MISENKENQALRKIGSAGKENGERESVAKKSNACADGLATAQQHILQPTSVVFAISVVNFLQDVSGSSGEA